MGRALRTRKEEVEEAEGGRRTRRREVSSREREPFVTSPISLPRQLA